ncbi:MAG: hypothetical protein ACT4QF_11000 [Sporichthyaceae bacterium]
MASWVPLVLVLALIPLVGAGFAARARVRRRAFARGEAVRLRAVLSGTRPPYPERFVAGRLELGEHPRWSANRARGVADVDFAGARVLGLDPAGMVRQMRPSDAMLIVELPDGERLRLITTGDDIRLIADALAATSAPAAGDAPPPRRERRRRPAVPWWSAILLALATGWAAFWTWAWVAGDVVDGVAVTDAVEEECRARWTEPNGTERVRKIDCPADAKAGDRLRVHAVPEPFTFASGDATLNLWFPVGIGVAGFLPSAGYALRPHLPRLPTPRARRRSVPEPRPHDGRDLGEGEVSYSAIAALQTERAGSLGWTVGPSRAREPIPRRWWKVASLRKAALYGLPRAAAPLFLVVLAALSGAPTWWAAVQLASGDVAVAQARVHESLGGVGPFMPNEIAIRFEFQGRTVEASVVHRGELEPGSPLVVQHSLAHPAAARVEGDGDGMDFVLATTGPLALAGLGWAGLRLFRLRREYRGLWLVHREAARPWRYVRFVDPLGVPALLLFSQFDDGPPAAVLPLAPPATVADGLPVAGTAMVHGQVRDLSPVLPVVDGRPLWALTPAQAVEPELVRDLLNGYLRDPGPAPPGRRRRAR